MLVNDAADEEERMVARTLDDSLSSPGLEGDPGEADTETALLLSAALSLHAATARLAQLDAESRAVARLAAEALMRGDVSRAALALVADVEGKTGILDLLRGSARMQPS